MSYQKVLDAWTSKDDEEFEEIQKILHDIETKSVQKLVKKLQG